MNNKDKKATICIKAKVEEWKILWGKINRLSNRQMRIALSLIGQDHLFKETLETVSKYKV